MGFASRTCAKTNLPIIHHGYDSWHSQYPEFFQIVVLFKDGRVMETDYEGYGHIGDVCIYFDTKWVLKCVYDGETYDQLGESHDEIGQGHFMAETFIKHCKTLLPAGFPTIKAYRQAFDRLAGW